MKREDVEEKIKKKIDEIKKLGVPDDIALQQIEEAEIDEINEDSELLTKYEELERRKDAVITQQIENITLDTGPIHIGEPILFLSEEEREMLSPNPKEKVEETNYDKAPVKEVEKTPVEAITYLLKVCENKKSGQKFVTIPKGVSVKPGDFVIVKKQV